MQKERPLPYLGYEYNGLNTNQSSGPTFKDYGSFTLKFLEDQHRIGGDTATGQIAYPGSVYGGTEVITSTERKRPEFNDVVHVRDYQTTVPFTYAKATYPGSVYTQFRRFYRDAPAQYPPIKVGAYQGSLFNVSARAWWSMQPRFEGDMSMLNFLFELKDFKDIAKFLLNHGLTNRLKKLGRPLRRFPDPSKSAATLHLLNSFVVSPLLSDYATIVMQAQQIVAEVQEEFKNLGQMRQKSHYSEELNHEVLYAAPGVSTGVPRKSMTVRSDRFTATLEYKYEFVPYSAYHAFMRFWGLRLTPEAIWNALPFSFLADYFVGIGKSLHAMELDPNVSLSIHRYCESVKSNISQGSFLYGDSTMTRGGYTILDSRLGPLQQRPIFTSGRRAERYVRLAKSPNKSMFLITGKTPGYKQKRNMLALLRCFIG